jgi:hypothetical protein
MSAEDHAILIGINHYPELLDDQGRSLNLKGSANDVKAVKAWLLEPTGGGFPDDTNIRVVTSRPATSADDAHPNFDELDAVLDELIRIARKNKMVVGRRLYLFMSGHGFSPEPQKGCLCTANATENKKTNVHGTGWLSWLQDTGFFSEIVFWMDCCMDGISSFRPGETFAQRFNAGRAPRAIFAAFAAKRDMRAVEAPVAEDGNRVHGLFTWTLLEGLRGAAADANGLVTGHSLADWIRNALAARFGEGDLLDARVAKEPEVIKEDANLIFARGVSKPFYEVRVSFPPVALGGVARLWCGLPLHTVKSFPVTGVPEILSLQPGLYLIDVASAGLRQGFEVVKPEEILIEEPGPAVSDVSPGIRFLLEVDPGDPAAEIFIIDSNFSLTESASGRLSTELPFGLFKIKTRAGRATKQRVILLDRDRPPIDRATIVQPVATVVPIFGTAASHEYQAAGMAEQLAKMRVLGDTGSRAALMVMARTFSVRDAPAGRTRPWEGMSIVDSQGETVLDLERDGEVHSDGDPFALCTKALEPGSYFLRQQFDGRTTLEQSIVVCDGWGHEIYVLRRVGPGESALRPRPRVSFMMRRLGQAAPSDVEDRLIETARIALADERRILNAELESLLLQKFENPMAGIIGGHLLLVERGRDPGRDVSLLDTVVRNLQSLVGTDHPDVAALALQCADAKLGRNVKTLIGPPMLQRSWKLLAEAAQKRPSLIPAAMWERVQALTALAPFLAWAVDETVKSAARQDLARAVFGKRNWKLAVEAAQKRPGLMPPAMWERARPISGAPEAPAAGGRAAFDLRPRRSAQPGAVLAAAPPAGTLPREAKARARQMNLPPSALAVLKEAIK